VTFDRATVRFRDGTVQAFRRDVSGYDNVTVTNTNLQFANTNAAYALYPVWILNTKWKDKSFRFAVNGQTGKIAGNLPISKAKATGFWFLFFFIFTAVIGGIIGGILLGNGGDIVSFFIGLAIGAVMGIIFATIILLAMRRKNKNVHFQYGAANYVRDNSFGINYRKSIYLYSRTSRTARANSNSR
jgi:hypothetical protein